MVHVVFFLQPCVLYHTLIWWINKQNKTERNPLAGEIDSPHNQKLIDNTSNVFMCNQQQRRAFWNRWTLGLDFGPRPGNPGSKMQVQGLAIPKCRKDVP